MTQTSHALAEQTSSEKAGGESTSVQYRTLFVDDNPEYRTKLTRFLQRNGLAIDPAKSGGEAIRLAARARYQTVVLDLRLTDMPPDMVYAKLRELQNEPLKLYILTAHPGDLDEEYEELRSQSVRVITKGSDPQFFKDLLNILSTGSMRSYEGTMEPPYSFASPDEMDRVSEAIVGIPGLLETLFLLAERRQATAKDMIDEGILPEDVVRIIHELKDVNVIKLTPDIQLTPAGRHLTNKLLQLSGV